MGSAMLLPPYATALPASQWAAASTCHVATLTHTACTEAVGTMPDKWHCKFPTPVPKQGSACTLQCYADLV